MRTTTQFLLVSAFLLGGAVLPAEAGSLTATFTTTPNGGQYAPNHVVAVWVEGPAGAFVKTIGRWSATRTGSLVAWKGKAPANDADAVSGATQGSHATPLTLTWNLTDKLGAVIPDGTYTVRMELADSNATQAVQNHQGTFTFVKGTTAQMQTALTNGGFTNVSLNFDPGATPPPTNPPPTNPPPSSGGGDAGLDNNGGDAIEGGCAAGGGRGNLATFALLGAAVLGLRRRRRA
ncbi:MAG: DUF2271 domain-containing protein [Myxococcales bacterium]|nr:DUF2271 domain-containing protein [Myxococcales bacterium]